MKKTIFFLAFLQIVSFTSKACDCALVPFCQYMQQAQVQATVQARVISSKNYSAYNQAVYLQVIKKYKDELSITDTIKLYGGPNEAACDVDVLQHFQIGDTVLLAFGYIDNYPPVENPDAANENYFGLRPQLCYLVELHVLDGIVNGPISTDVWQYPLDRFDDALSDCSFTSLPHPNEYPDNYIRIYPNPTADGKVYLDTNLPLDLIDRIRVFSIDGRMIREMTGLNNGQVYMIDIGDLNDALYILEIQCEEKQFYRKLEVGSER